MVILSRLVPATPCVAGRWVPEFRFGLFSLRCAGQPVSSGFEYSTIRTPHFKAVPPREIHLWYILPDEISGSSISNEYLDMLCSSERVSILSINDRNLQKGALLARVLVRTALSRYTDGNISPRRLKFRKNIFGKPELDWEDGDGGSLPPLQFNLSHTPSLIACGISRNLQIGIDVEEKDRRLRNNILLFAKRYFTTEEVLYLQRFSDSDIQRRELIKLWTLKEAYVKALGRGFSAAPFRDFFIRYQPHVDAQGLAEDTDLKSHTKQSCIIKVEPCVDVGYLTTNWQFMLLELGRSHYVAICVEKDDLAAAEGEKLPLLKVWKTIPLVRDEVVTGAEVVTICGVS